MAERRLTVKLPCADANEQLKEYNEIFGSPEEAQRAKESLHRKFPMGNYYELVEENKELKDTLNMALTKVKELETNQVTMIDYGDLLRIGMKTLTGYESSIKRHAMEHNDAYDAFKMREQDALANKLMTYFLALCREEIGKR